MSNKIISFIASKQIDEAVQVAIKETEEKFRSRRRESKIEELRNFVGRKVIVFSNNWDDMVFGTGTEVSLITTSLVPVLCIEDALTGNESFCLGQITMYSREMLKALLKLTPYERWNIRVRHSEVFWDKPNGEPLTPPEEVVRKLIAAGFY